MNMEWVRAALIRAVKTMAQGAVALIGTSTVSVVDLDWPQILGCVATMGVLSILTSLAGLPEVDRPAELTEAEVNDYTGGEDDDLE